MPFKPGQTGNPGGRPKVDVRVKELARGHTEKAIETLVKALDNERTCVAAATALLDRGWGKPAQAITGEDGGAILTETLHTFGSLAALSDTELETLTALTEKAAGAATVN